MNSELGNVKTSLLLALTDIIGIHLHSRRFLDHVVSGLIVEMKGHFGLVTQDLA